MKKDAFLMLIAGAVLGAVLAFIGTRQYYLGKMAAVPPPQAPQGEAPPQGAAQGSQEFDPSQHMAMVSQIEAEVAKDPNNVEKRVLLGNIYYDAGKWAEAIPYYEQALKLDPANTDVMVDLGVCYRNQKRPDDALAMFNQALKLDPTKKQALFNEVVVYGFDKGNKTKAQELLKEFRSKYPGEPMGKQLAGELAK